MLYEAESSGENSSYMHLIQPLITSLSANESKQSILEISYSLLLAIFGTDIEKKLSNDFYKEANKAPTPVQKSVLDDAISIISSKNGISIIVNYDYFFLLSYFHYLRL